MSQDQISAPLTKDQAYALVDAVMERDDLAITASAHEDVDTGEWVFQATCDSPPDVAAFEALAEAVLGGVVGFSVEAIDPEVDWVSRSLEGLKPVAAGGFYVFGSHDAETAPEGLIPIHIDAAQAFGTGHHETTTGCLEAIDKVLSRSAPARPIDIGTGTGILAIAIAKRLPVRIIASDIDPVAVTTTAENVELNGVAEHIVPLVAEGLEHGDIAASAPYDLIVANILAGPLIDLAPGIGGIAAAGADIIISGLLDTQAEKVIAAYEAADMALEEKIVRGDWATLMLRKGAAASAGQVKR